MQRLILIIFLQLTLFPVWGQEPAPKPESASEARQEKGQQEAFRIGVSVDQVFLSITARTINGGFYKDLSADDFEIYEDGVKQEIVNFAYEAVPVKVVLLVDASGSTRFSQTDIRRAAMHFVESLGPEDEVAIISFNDKLRLILDWTNDRERMAVALESIYAKGATLLNDSLYVTFTDLLKDVPGKKAVILLTDGIDSGSWATFEQALDLAVRSEAIVYVASKLEEYWALAVQARSQQVPGWTAPQLRDDYIVRAKKNLHKLANMTGGRVLQAEAFSSLIEVYAAVAEELKNQYYISYLPSNSARDGSWREIQIKSRADVISKTRPGYYAPEG